MSGWCKRCGRFDVWGKGCKCEHRGSIWFEDDGEDSSVDLWSIYADLTLAIDDWAKRRLQGDIEFMTEGRTETFAFRTEGGAVRLFNVCFEMKPEFHVTEINAEGEEIQ